MENLINLDDLDVVIISKIPYKIVSHMEDDFILIEKQFLSKFKLVKNFMKTINKETELPTKVILKY